MAETKKYPGPSEEELAALKAKYKKITRIVFDEDTVYYIREITRREHRLIMEGVKKLDQNIQAERGDEMLVQTAVVWPTIQPDDYANTGAGYIPTLALTIMAQSGFRDPVVIEAV